VVARRAATGGRPVEVPGLILRSMRPRQWAKNGVVLVGLIFARELIHPEQVARALAAVLLFSLVSGAVYLANDLLDVEKDRLHPTKRHRPLASGRLSPAVAMVTAGAIAVLGLGAAFALSPGFGVVLVTYLALQAITLRNMRILM
jgi:4-hydroxybenzoate polyprenyltransferase